MLFNGYDRGTCQLDVNHVLGQYFQGSMREKGDGGGKIPIPRSVVSMREMSKMTWRSQR